MSSSISTNGFPSASCRTGPLFKEVAEAYDTMVCNEMPHGTAKSYRPAIQRAVAYFGEQRMSEIEPYMVTKFLASLPYKGKKQSQTSAPS